MKIDAIKTEVIRHKSIDLFEFLDRYVEKLEEKSVVVVSSKVLSLITGNVLEMRDDYADVIRGEAEYVSDNQNRYGHFLTVKNNAFISGSGIDHSNGDGKLILLPKEPYALAKKIYTHLSEKFHVSDFGIIITDSQSVPLRRGALGVSIGFHGFAPLHDYVGEKDIFGRNFRFEKANLVDQIASAANLAMGEGSEQTPIVVVSDLQGFLYGSELPTQEQLREFLLTPEEDIFHILYEDKLHKARRGEN